MDIISSFDTKFKDDSNVHRAGNRVLLPVNRPINL